MNDRFEHKVAIALRFIENNLEHPISREEIASEANLSLRQFHRVFYRCTGDSIANYVKIRRLTQASKHLIHSSDSVLTTALKYQFNSPEVFGRAFQRAFWHLPSHFKQIGSAYTAKQRDSLLGEQMGTIQRSNMNQPDILCLPTRHFVGFLCVQPHYGFRVAENLNEGKSLTDLLWDQVSTLAGVVDQRVWNIAFVQRALPQFHEIENFYAVEVKKPLTTMYNLTCLQVPSGQYARFMLLGPQRDMSLLLSLAFQWLEKSPYYLGNAPSLCRIDPNLQQPTELYLPISSVFLPYLTWWQGYDAKYLKAIGGL